MKFWMLVTSVHTIRKRETMKIIDTLTWHIIISTSIDVWAEHKSIMSTQRLLFMLVHHATTPTTGTCLFLRCWTNLIRPQNKGGRISISLQWMWSRPPTRLLLLGWAHLSMIHGDRSLTASSLVWEQLPAELLASGRPARRTTREEEDAFEMIWKIVNNILGTTHWNAWK